MRRTEVRVLPRWEKSREESLRSWICISPPKDGKVTLDHYTIKGQKSDTWPLYHQRTEITLRTNTSSSEHARRCSVTRTLSLPLQYCPLGPCQAALFLGASVTNAIRELSCSGNKPFKSQVQGDPALDQIRLLECVRLGGGSKADSACESESADPELSKPAGQPAHYYTDNQS